MDKLIANLTDKPQKKTRKAVKVAENIAIEVDSTVTANNLNIKMPKALAEYLKLDSKAKLYCVCVNGVLHISVNSPAFVLPAITWNKDEFAANT